MRSDAKTLLLIGGSSSIGLEIIAVFKRAGWSIHATYTSNGAVTSTSDQIKWYQLDLQIEQSIIKFSGEFFEACDTVDLVVLANGMLLGKSLSAYTYADMAATMSINAIGVAFLLQRLNTWFKGHEHLIALSSIAASNGSYDPLYAASKAALESLVKHFAASADFTAGRFNILSLGLVEGSAMYEAMSFDNIERHIMETPTGELLKIEDVGEIILDIDGSCWRQMNGAVVAVNGGRGL